MRARTCKLIRTYEHARANLRVCERLWCRREFACCSYMRKHRTRFNQGSDRKQWPHESWRQMQRGKRTVVERPRPGRRQRGSSTAESMSVSQPTSSSYSDAVNRAITNTHCDHGECQHKRHHPTTSVNTRVNTSVITLPTL